MLPGRASNPGPLTYESGALPIALRGPAVSHEQSIECDAFCVKCDAYVHKMSYNGSHQVTVLIICLLYTFSQRNSIFKLNYAGKFNVSCGMFSNIISLILRASDTDSENASLLWRYVSDGQKTCS